MATYIHLVNRMENKGDSLQRVSSKEAILTGLNWSGKKGDKPGIKEVEWGVEFSNLLDMGKEEKVKMRKEFTF